MTSYSYCLWVIIVSSLWLELSPFASECLALEAGSELAIKRARYQSEPTGSVTFEMRLVSAVVARVQQYVSSQKSLLPVRTLRSCLSRPFDGNISTRYFQRSTLTSSSPVTSSSSLISSSTSSMASSSPQLSQPCTHLTSNTVETYQSISASQPHKSFHKRELPSSLVSFSSPEGRKLFKEALAAGTLESFFPLSEQFVTQSEPSFCALSSLSMVCTHIYTYTHNIYTAAFYEIHYQCIENASILF